jgi:adenylate cyclase
MVDVAVRRTEDAASVVGDSRDDDADAGVNGVAAGIRREERTGLGYMFWGRLLALGMLALWVAATLPFERSGAYLAAIVLFAVLGAPPYFLARWGLGGWKVTAFFLLIDVALLTYILIAPPPFFGESWTPQLTLRLPNFLYLGVFLVGMALSFSPALVIWTGFSAVAAWTAGVLWIASLPDSLASSSRDVLDRGSSTIDVMERFANPKYVSLTTLYNQIVFLTLITLVLAIAVWRSRQLVRRQAAAEAGHAALSRYFSPNIVRELSTRAEALATPSVQPVAILFADMVGFTAISEHLPPTSLVDLLREFHGRLERVAFEHGGTIDKYIGDAIMVNFGTPRTRKDDPARALSCAAAMLDEIQSWNAKRTQTGEVSIGLGIGVHYGDVLVGNIGGARRLEYTVLGDTVNVASRLERLTRDIGAVLVVSDDLVRAVRSCGVEPSAVIQGLRPDETRTVRGRREPVAIWYLPATAGVEERVSR